jgi:hypothetical protein
MTELVPTTRHNNVGLVEWIASGSPTPEQADRLEIKHNETEAWIAEQPARASYSNPLMDRSP